LDLERGRKVLLSRKPRNRQYVKDLRSDNPIDAINVKYRHSDGVIELWQYEYAFGPSPAVLQPIPTTPLNLSRSIPTTTPIQCTKEDLELKAVYAPRYSYQPSYTSTPYEYMTMGMREPVVAGTDLTKKGEGKKEDIKGEVKKVPTP